MLNKQTNTTVTKQKRGTIGYAIAQLVKKYGNGTTGMYILEQAYVRVTGDKVNMYESPGYKKMAAVEKEIFAQIEAERASRAAGN